MYLNGALSWKKETDKLLDDTEEVTIDLDETEKGCFLRTNLYDVLEKLTEGTDFHPGMIHSDILGKAFEPEERYENPDGSPILFNKDYRGDHRGTQILPGPFASRESAEKVLAVHLCE